MFATMRKPKWLALLAAVLVTVVGFGWLGWWQLTAAFTSATAPEDAEAYATTSPLGELITPGEGIAENAAGRPVVANGWLDTSEPVIVGNRLQGDAVGWWVVARFVVANDGAGGVSPLATSATDATVAQVLPSIPVAIGWAPSEDAARESADRLAAAAEPLPPSSAADSLLGAVALEAHLQPGQDPVVPRNAPDPFEATSMAPGQLINRWSTPSPAYYSAYIVGDAEALAVSGASGLEPVEIVPVDQSFQLNLLNVFYAIEWAIFIVMAFYIWWRLVRDEHLAELTIADTADERLEAEIRREKLRELAARRAADPAADIASGLAADPTTDAPRSAGEEIR